MKLPFLLILFIFVFSKRWCLNFETGAMWASACVIGAWVMVGKGEEVNE